MLKNILMGFVLCFTTVLFAQEIAVISRNNIPAEKDIVDLLMEKNQQLLLNKEGNILEITDGKITIGKKNQLKEFYKRKIKGALPQNFDINRYKYLTKGNGIYYVGRCGVNLCRPSLSFHKKRWERLVFLAI